MPLQHLVHGSALRRLSTEALLGEDATLEVRCLDAYSAVTRYEELHRIDASLIDSSLLQQRSTITDAALQFGLTLGFKV